MKLSANAFAGTLGKSSSTINFILKGETKPGFELLEAILEKYPQVSATWLVKGEGEMFTPSAPAASALPADYLLNYLKQLEEQFGRVAEQLAVKDRQMEGMQRTIDTLLGKYKGATLKTHPATPSFRIGLSPRQQA